MRRIALAVVLVAILGALHLLAPGEGPPVRAPQATAQAGAPAPAGDPVEANLVPAEANLAPVTNDQGAASPGLEPRSRRSARLRAKLVSRESAPPAPDTPTDPATIQRLLQEERAAAEAAGVDWRLMERMVSDGARAVEGEAR